MAKKNENWGGRRNGAGRPRQYKRVPISWGRGHDQEFAQPARLSPEHPTDPQDIVLAQNSDGRYGIYIEDAWFGAGQALSMLQYLEKHKAWLTEKSVENERRSSMKEVNFTDIPLEKRPEAHVWQVLVEQASQGQAILFQEGDNYSVQFPDEPDPIPFERLAYHRELGLYDTRKFPNIQCSEEPSEH